MSLKNNIPKTPHVKPHAELTCSRCGAKFKHLNEQGLCTSCAMSLENTNKNLSADSELGKLVIELIAQGMTSSQIVKQTGCSKSTVSYYRARNGKNNSLERHRKYNKTIIGKFVKRLSTFKCRVKGNGTSKCTD